MVLLSWSALVKSLFLFVKSLSYFLFTIAQGCINFATVKIVLFCIVLYIGLCVSIKVIKKKNFIYLKPTHYSSAGNQRPNDFIKM